MNPPLSAALDRRQELIARLVTTQHPRAAFRLFDGFREAGGAAGGRFVLDVYGTTLVVFDHPSRATAAEAAPSTEVDPAAGELADFVMSRLSFLKTAVYKPRVGDPVIGRGQLMRGEEQHVTRSIEEEGVRYTVRLLVHQDATFYLDTRNLRDFLRREARGKRVLNTFAYSGSLGVAARSAGAKRVIQTDRSKDMLTIAKDSYALNGFAVERSSFVAGDFFDVASKLRKAGELFDFVIIDPPVFADSPRGRVDLSESFGRIVDKVRPLVGDGGRLIVVNNALFVSGAEFNKMLETVVGEEYASVEERVDVPEDCAPPRVEGSVELPADPSPYNHPTKIAVLRLKRRDGRKA